MKYLFFFLFAIILLLNACSDDSTSSISTDLKDGVIGTWNVKRTLSSSSNQFPNGYTDYQVWSFQKSGDNVVLSTNAGSVNGQWKSTQTWAANHWVFETTVYSPEMMSNYKVLVEIIGVSPLKGTNETYYQDPSSGIWFLLDAFKIEGTKQ